MEVVFLHGFASNSAVWQGYKVKNATNIFFDIKFDKNNSPILPKIKSNTVLVGWSMGGMVALEILKRFPQEISAIFLLSSSPGFMKSDIFPKGKSPQELKNFREMFFDSDGRGVAKFQKQLFSKEEIKSGWLKKFRKEIAGKIKLEKETLISSLFFLENYEITAIPENFKNIFVFHGKNDVVVDVDATNSWKKVFKNAKISILDASHSLPFVKKELVLTEIQKFCDEYK